MGVDLLYERSTGYFCGYCRLYYPKGMESKVVNVPFNLIGLALLSVGVGCLQVLLDKGKELGWLASDEIVTLAVISAIALVFGYLGTNRQTQLLSLHYLNHVTSR